MRSKNADLKVRIYDFVNDWKRAHEKSPSLKNIADALAISRTTAYRYLMDMNEKGELHYDGNSIGTKELNRENTMLSLAKVVGSIPCGASSLEEEHVEQYHNLPTSIFGNGELYILHAQGDSMVDVGIDEGDLVVIRRQSTARIGDIVVALDEDYQNTLKQYEGTDGNGHAVLAYRNQAVYPDKNILTKQLIIQGVAQHVIKQL